MKNLGLCHICLRTDKKLKKVHYILSEFHDQLLEYILNTDNLSYCIQCAYLLQKTYNFYVRCKNAAEILKSWKKTKSTNKKPMHLLYNELPPSTLGLWTPDNARVHRYTCDEDGNTSLIILKSDNVDSTTPKLSTENESLNKDVVPIKEEKEENSKEQLNSGVSAEVATETQETEKLFVTPQDDVTPLADFRDINVDDDNDFKNILTSDFLNDHCFVEPTEPVSNTSKKTLADLANIDLSDEEPPYDVQIINDDVLKTEQINDAVNESDVDDEWKIEELVESDDMKSYLDSTDEEDFELFRDMLSTGVKTEKKSILDEKPIKSSRSWRNKFINEVKQLKLEPLHIERLKEKLKARFDMSGELICNDGTKIDKKLILDNFPGELDGMALKRLWIKLNLKRTFVPSAIVLLKSIQNDYKNFSQYRTVFDIEYLDTEEKALEEFQNRKTYECYVKAKFKCDICYQALNDKMVKYHKTRHEISAGNFSCKICKVRYLTNKLLTNHKISHKAVYKCKICPLVTYYRSSMINHYHNHLGKQYMCNICGVFYKSLSSYNSHRVRHATPYACAACGRSYVSDLSLKTHIKRVHKDEPMDNCPMKCEVCKLGFTSLEALKRHSTNHKQRYFYNKEPQPPRDPSVITSKPSVKGTKRDYTVKCGVCDTVGKVGGWLGYHYRNEHPELDLEHRNIDKKTLLCQYCGKRYTNVTSLREHINKHIGERPFACSKCPKKFFSRPSLMLHMQWHYPPTQICQECGKKFHTKSCLYNHLVFHNGNRRYKCKICGKGFLSSSTLKEHFRGVHLQVRRVKKRKTNGESETGQRKKKYVVEENTE